MRSTAEFDGKDVRAVERDRSAEAPSDRQVVVMAHRDAAGRPGASSASSTAALLELAQALDGSSRKKTFVFVSADGSAAGGAGARRFAESYGDRDKVDALLVLDDIGAASAAPAVRGALVDQLAPRLAAGRAHRGRRARKGDPIRRSRQDSWPASSCARPGRSRCASRARWSRTASTRSRSPRAVSCPAAMDRTRSTRSRATGSRSSGAPPSERRSHSTATRTIEASPRRYLVAGGKVIPDWAIALLAVSLVLPAVVAAFDAFARARRRRLPVGDWIRWTLAAALPFALAVAVALLFEAIGWLPDSVAEALSPAAAPSAGEAILPLLGILVCFAVGWVFVRPAFGGHLRAESSTLGLSAPAAAVALALVLSIEVLLVCVVDPFTALMLVPAAHLCLLAALPERPRRSLLAGGILAGALLLPVLALGYYGVRLDLGADPVALRVDARGVCHRVGLDRRARLAAGGHPAVRGDRLPRAGAGRGVRRPRDGPGAGHLRRPGLAGRDGVGPAALGRPAGAPLGAVVARKTAKAGNKGGVRRRAGSLRRKCGFGAQHASSACPASRDDRANHAFRFEPHIEVADLIRIRIPHTAQSSSADTHYAAMASSWPSRLFRVANDTAETLGSAPNPIPYLPGFCCLSPRRRRPT